MDPTNGTGFVSSTGDRARTREPEMARVAPVLHLLLILALATPLAAQDQIPPKTPEEQAPPETPIPEEPVPPETPEEPAEEPVPETPLETPPVDEPEVPGALEEAIDEVEEPTRVPETVVTPTRGEREVFDVPKAVTVISKDTIAEYSPTQIVDVLTRRSPGIIMDIRTSTAGDPIMRGWAGFNILTLIDGNTLSTLWGEGGFGADDMYSKVDPDTIERIEVVHGPHSALYGSNALGGVINFLTRSSPIDYVEEGFDWGGREKYTYSSAANAHRFRTEAFGATDRFKFLAGWTYTEVDDLEGGRGVGTLEATSGTGSFVDFRGDFLIDRGQELTVAVQDVTWRDTMRYYRPMQENNADRTGVTAIWRASSIAEYLRSAEVRAYYQYKKDEREWNDDPATAANEKRDGYAKTITYALDAQASTEVTPGQLLTYGAHFSRDEGESADDEQFTFTEPGLRAADAPDTTWTDYAAYVQDEFAVHEMVDLVGSLRYDYFIFRSHSTSHYRAGEPEGERNADFFRDVEDSWTGGVGMTVKPAPEWRFMASYSRGFRQHAPNFGFRQLGNGVLIPNELLDPVTADNYEVGFRTKYPAVRAEGFAYFSDVDDWQDIRPDTSPLGEPPDFDWFDFNDNGVRDPNEDVVSVQNARGAYITGFELSGTVYPNEICGEIPPNYSLNGGLAYSYGRTNDGDWFRHTMPLRGLMGLRWDDLDPRRKAYFELQVEMVDRYSRIPEGRVDGDLGWKRDPQDPVDGKAGRLRSYGGTPGYTIYSIYGGMNVCESTRVTIAVENLTDKKYRRAHSRMDAPGVNVVLGVDVSF
jgi:outer membrane receptor protein involved in Fe transport